MPDEVQHELPLMYNWTEVERYDSTDLRLWLRGLRPYAQYEILVQAFNQFGRGPMARAKALTLSDGKNFKSKRFTEGEFANDVTICR